MNRHKVIKKISKIFVVLTMIFSMCFQSSNIAEVNAYDVNVPKQFTRVKNIKYPTWWKTKCPSITKQWSTFMCKYNDQWSYCLESSKNTPINGSYTSQVIENNAMVRKLLYYGFGGPGASDTNGGLDGNPNDGKGCGALTDDGLGYEETAYLYTHILLSLAYSGDLCGANIDELETLGIGLKGLYNFIGSLPEPTKANFNGQTRASFTASFDKNNKEQKTNTVTFNGGSNSTINIPLQANVTLHNVTTGASQTGGNATVYGGQSFYLTAPCKNSPTNYQTGDIAGNNCARFTALAIVPGGDKQTHGSWALDPAYLDLTVNWLDFGSIEINKTNTNKDLIDGAEFNLRSTSYDGYDENFVVKNGKIVVEDLLVGTYQLKELNAPDGYLLNTDTFTITVEKDKTSVQPVLDEEPTGKIEFTKEIDASETHNLIGDAYAKDVTFKLYANEKISNKAGTIKFYDKDEVVATSKTDAQGKIVWNNLPLGNYYIKESKTNDSLVFNDTKINVSITYEGQTVKQVSRTSKGSNKVNKQKIQVFKSGEREGISGVVKGLQGAEFTWKLKSEVDHVGWDQAQTYAIITTNENGRAVTDYLPYGKYIVRETKTPGKFITAPDFTVSVTKDSSEYKELEQIKLININNRPFASYVKLIKVDEESGKKVTLNSASFKIKNSKGNYITQKVSGKKVDTFTTNSDNEIVPLVDKGTVTLPLMLDAGIYLIEEIKTPKGFLELKEPVQFTISSTRDYDKDEDADPIVEVIIRNRQPKAEIIINKTVTDLKTDTDLVDRTDLSKIQFVLKAKENIYSSIDGALLFKKDESITLKKSGGILKQGTEIGNGIYSLSKDGHLYITNLPMSSSNASYYLQETKTLNGCVLNKKIYDVTFKQTDTKKELYSKTFNIENKTTYFEFNKTDITGDKEVPGAQLTVKDEEGNVIDQWISNDKLHSIEGLIVGKTYTLSETVTAKDYVKATDIKFTVKNSSELETVIMKDKQVSFSKTDITGDNEIEGATIVVSEKHTGKVVDEWISTNKNHLINGLVEGKSYILSEKIAPEEFVKASDIEFTVTKEKVNQKIIMKDKQVSISKSTIGGEEVVGASMQILDQDGNIIDEWISEGKEHFASNLEEGKSYILHEDLSPLGLNLANDIDFVVTFDKENQKIEMIDTINEVFKVKEDGSLLKDAELTVVSSKTKQVVDKWTSGQHVFDVTEDMKSQIKENKKAEGMYIDEDDSTITYSISKNKNRDDYRLLFVKDGTTTYTNIDLDGNETTHLINGLIAGEEYILRETKTPNGYATSKEQTFKAEENDDISLTMIDEDIKVQISKQDITNKNEIEGAQLKVVDKDGKIIDEWSSKKEPHMIKNLNVGESYTLIEETAPKGYKVAESIEFKIQDTGEIQHVVMYDEHLPVKVKTGDDNSYQYWTIAAILSLAALIIVKIKIEKEKK